MEDQKQKQSEEATTNVETHSEGGSSKYSRTNKSTLTKLSEVDRENLEVRIIMTLPEVKDELLKRANPNNFDLYMCAFGEGGEL